MEYVRVRKTDLARNTSQIIRNVLRGQPTVIENHGQPEVAIVDVIDYLILRAVASFHAGNNRPLDPGGPAEAEFAGLSLQERYNRAMDYYLAEACSTGRMADLLQIPWIELRERFNRLEVPLFLGPRSIDEAREDAANARKWADLARQTK
jgi:antitoxin (DNA-binding transcriptional repressor) of toxin-antitoxin stability system